MPAASLDGSGAGESRDDGNRRLIAGGFLIEDESCEQEALGEEIDTCNM